MINLRVENGLLLKEYMLPFDRELGRHVDAPAPWTQDRDEKVQSLADEIMDESAKHLDKQDQSREMALQVAEAIVRKQLAEKRLPVRGWVPVTRSTRHNVKLIDAFKQYWLSLHPLDDASIKFVHADPVPDGYYIYRNAEVKPID